MSSNSKRYFVTALDTDAGKTLIAAILTQALSADYWKPIQSGDLHYSDTDKVKEMVSNTACTYFPNTYSFKEPASPHYSAALEDVEIDIKKFVVPQTDKNLIIEGAGGLMVPLNDSTLLIDLIKKLEIEVIFVIKNYLGSINHSLLSIEALQKRGIPIRGIVFNGPIVVSSEDYILKYTNLPFLGRVEQLEVINKQVIKDLAKQFEFLKND